MSRLEVEGWMSEAGTKYLLGSFIFIATTVLGIIFFAIVEGNDCECEDETIGLWTFECRFINEYERCFKFNTASSEIIFVDNSGFEQVLEEEN